MGDLCLGKFWVKNHPNTRGTDDWAGSVSVNLCPAWATVECGKPSLSKLVTSESMQTALPGSDGRAVLIILIY